MKSTDKSLSCDDVLERVDAFIDGDLPPEEHPAVEIHLQECASCAEEVAFAREMQLSLRSVPHMDCPDRVVEAVYRHIDIQSAPAPRTVVAERPSLIDMLRSWFSSPRLVPALGVAVVVAVVGLWFFNTGSPNNPSAAEVADAKRQVEWTIAYLGSVNEKVTAVATSTVLQPYVVEPVQRAVETAIQPNAALE